MTAFRCSAAKHTTRAAINLIIADIRRIYLAALGDPGGTPATIDAAVRAAGLVAHLMPAPTAAEWRNSESNAVFARRHAHEAKKATPGSGAGQARMAIRDAAEAIAASVVEADEAAGIVLSRTWLAPERMTKADELAAAGAVAQAAANTHAEECLATLTTLRGLLRTAA